MSEVFDLLQKRIVKNEKLGQEWVEAQAKWMQLDETRKNFLAIIQNQIEKAAETKISDVKLERLARGTTEYGDFITGLCAAKAAELSAKVKYDNACELFRAMQSAQAFEREKLRLNI